MKNLIEEQWREFDERFRDFNGISKRIAENNSTWIDAECEDIKSFLASSNRAVIERVVDEIIENIPLCRDRITKCDCRNHDMNDAVFTYFADLRASLLELK